MQPSSFSRRQVLARLCALPLSVSFAVPMDGHAARSDAPLLLAQDAALHIDPAGYLVSEKYDGVRAWWDGHDLRFRSGTAIAAPPWFLAQLPATPLDGELWLGRGRFEALSAAVRRQQPDDAPWRQIRFMLFELPGAAGTFADRAQRIRLLAQQQRTGALVAAQQATVPDRAALQAMLKTVVDGGGEGLMLHRADAPYTVGRSPVLLKLKPLHDADATVLAHAPGRGRHAGRLGALQVQSDAGLVFFIGTGLSDAERNDPPPPGARISYSHRGHTRDGVPRFASYLRRRTV